MITMIWYHDTDSLLEIQIECFYMHNVKKWLFDCSQEKWLFDCSQEMIKEIICKSS